MVEHLDGGVEVAIVVRPRGLARASHAEQLGQVKLGVDHRRSPSGTSSLTIDTSAEASRSAEATIRRTLRWCRSYGGQMGAKSTPSSQPKKPTRSLKEKRAAKHAKQATQEQVRRGWNAK